MKMRILVILVVVAVAWVIPAATVAENETDDRLYPPGVGPDSTLAGRNVVLIEGTGFVPDPITIRAGETLTWVNNDSVPHTIVSALPGSGELPGINSGVIAPGGRFTAPFTEPGTYIYRSTTTGMTGTIIVGGMGGQQPPENVTEEGTEATPVPGGDGEIAPLLSPLAGSPSPPANATPGRDQEIAPGEGPAGVVSVNVTGNQTPAVFRTSSPSGSGVAPDVTETPTVARTTAMTEDEQPSTKPRPAPSSMMVVIGALAVAGLGFAVELRR